MNIRYFCREKLNISKLDLSKNQKLSLFFVLFFFYFFFFISSSGRNSSNDGGHMALASTIYFDHQLSIEKYDGNYLSAPDYAIKDGVMYSDRLPGNSICIIPFLAYSDAVKTILPEKTSSKGDYFFISASLLPNLAGVVGLFLLFLFNFQLFKFNFSLSLLIVLICGIATLYQLESTHLFSHIISLVGITLAIYLTVLGKNWKNWSWTMFCVAGIIGFSTLVELQNILFIIPIFFYLMIANNISIIKLKTYFNRKTIITASILFFFIGLLLSYNYITFGEFFLKSNKYNPFFEEEKTFLTALSGNFFEGLDNLITSFNNLPAYFDWSKAVNNGNPGILIANPVFIFSFLGFIPFHKKHKLEALLFITLIIISILIAAFHVTTLVRHIFTIHVLLYFPIVFFVDWIKTQNKILRALLYGSFVTLTIISFVKEIYLNNHYWGRNYDFTHFEYFKNLDIFVYLNLPFILIIGIALYYHKKRTV